MPCVPASTGCTCSWCCFSCVSVSTIWRVSFRWLWCCSCRLAMEVSSKCSFSCKAVAFPEFSVGGMTMVAHDVRRHTYAVYTARQQQRRRIYAPCCPQQHHGIAWSLLAPCGFTSRAYTVCQCRYWNRKKLHFCSQGYSGPSKAMCLNQNCPNGYSVAVLRAFSVSLEHAQPPLRFRAHCVLWCPNTA